MRLPKSLRAIVRVKRGLADPVREFVQRTPGGSRVVMALLAQAIHDEEATKIVVAWSRLSSGPHRSRMPDKQFDWDGDPRTGGYFSPRLHRHLHPMRVGHQHRHGTGHQRR